MPVLSDYKLILRVTLTLRFEKSLMPNNQRIKFANKYKDECSIKYMTFSLLIHKSVDYSMTNLLT